MVTMVEEKVNYVTNDPEIEPVKNWDIWLGIALRTSKLNMKAIYQGE